jgi:hypothetical protein
VVSGTFPGDVEAHAGIEAPLGLDPCHWGTPLTATLAAGQTRTGLQIRLPAISQLRVRLEDPRALLGERSLQLRPHWRGNAQNQKRGG